MTKSLRTRKHERENTGQLSLNKVSEKMTLLHHYSKPTKKRNKKKRRITKQKRNIRP